MSTQTVQTNEFELRWSDKAAEESEKKVVGMLGVVYEAVSRSVGLLAPASQVYSEVDPPGELEVQCSMLQMWQRCREAQERLLRCLSLGMI